MIVNKTTDQTIVTSKEETVVTDKVETAHKAISTVIAHKVIAHHSTRVATAHLLVIETKVEETVAEMDQLQIVNHSETVLPHVVETLVVLAQWLYHTLMMVATSSRVRKILF